MKILQKSNIFFLFYFHFLRHVFQRVLNFCLPVFIFFYMEEEIIFQKQVDTLKDIQNNILLEDDPNSDENLQNLESIFSDLKIKDNQYELLLLLHLILNISNNHFRFPNFFSKIENILLIFKLSNFPYF